MHCILALQVAHQLNNTPNDTRQDQTPFSIWVKDKKQDQTPFFKTPFFRTPFFRHLFLQWKALLIKLPDPLNLYKANALLTGNLKGHVFAAFLAKKVPL